MTFKRTLVLLAAGSLIACGGKADNSTPASDAAGLAQTSDSLVSLGEEQTLPPPPPETPAEPAKPTPPPPVNPKPAPPPPAAKPAPPASKPAPPAAKPTPVEPAPPAAVLAVGKTIATTLVDSVHSRYSKVGDVVKARVSQDITGADGTVLIPAGAIVSLKVTEIGMADSRGEKGTLALKATEVSFDGKNHAINADATDYEYEMKARGIQGGDVAKTGAGAAAGALIGRVVGGKKGTVGGALVGGAVGAAVASSTADRDIIVHAGQKLTLTLKGDFNR